MNKKEQTNHIGDANKMVTAVEWLYRWSNDNQEATIKEWINAFEQAKEMEKKQIIDAANGYTQTEYLGVSRGEQYYNEKYKK